MARWSIGPIVGQYQPEDFTEKQSVQYDDVKAFGIVRPILFKNVAPREVTLSFVVNAMGITEGERENMKNSKIPNAPNQSDPEVVWATICAMMRPGDGSALPPLLGGQRDNPRNFPRVVIPGWNVGGANTPVHAVITDASIKRTHIAGSVPPRAVRAIITVTLREKRRAQRERAQERSRNFETQFNKLAEKFTASQQEGGA